MLKNLKISNNTGIIIGVLFIVFGISIMSYNYLNEKKKNVFTSMNIKLFQNNMPNIVEDEKDNLTEKEIEEEQINIEEASSNNANPNYTHYKGVIEIPKIKLKNGFLDVNSPYNSIDYNVTVISPSDMPNIENGNLILAAHSGDGYIAFFRNLYKLSKGDEAYIYYSGTKYKYKITKIYTQPKVGQIEIKRNNKKSTLTLITCTEGDDKTQTVYILEQI